MAKSKDGEKDKGGSNQITLSVVVNGAPAEISANVNAPLQTIIAQSLAATGNVGQGPEGWDVLDNGAVLDRNRKIGEFGFTPATRLFINLKAGAGGV